MKIAVIMGGIRFDSQKRILNGIIEKAKEDQADIYVFSCDVWSYSTTQFITGEMEIYKLPILRTMMVSLFMVIRYIMLRRLQILFRMCMMPEYPVLI